MDNDNPTPALPTHVPEPVPGTTRKYDVDALFGVFPIPRTTLS